MNALTPLDHARILLSRGFAPIPVPHKQKGPRLANWQKLRPTAEDLPHLFNCAPSNVGILLGEASGGLIDIDLDHPLAVELAPQYLPATDAAFGRASKPRSHFLYRVTRPVQTLRLHADAPENGRRGAKGATIVEVRSDGCQTIFPGSTHPSGELIEWASDGEPQTVAPETLVECAHQLANAVREELGQPPIVQRAKQRDPVHAPPTGETTRYGRAALTRAAGAVAGTERGSRNIVLNAESFGIGQLVAGGEVDRADAERELLAAAHKCGLGDGEATRAVRSALDAGAKSPRQRPEDTRDGRCMGRKAEEPTLSQAEEVARLGMQMLTLGMSEKREPFAVVKDGPAIAMPLGGSGGSGGSLRDLLAREYRRRHKRTASAAALGDALAALRGEAMDCSPKPTYLRVAPHGAGAVLDLGTPDGVAVVITPEGWTVEPRSPVLFRRTALTGVLPVPERGGAVDELREVLNVSADAWPLVVGWLVAAMLDIPHPILLLGGQQGTGKTTAARLLCGLFDPSDAPIRSQPRDPESWAMAVGNSWSSVVDNISSIPGWWSDALCKVVTGDAWVRRMLYTDGDVAIMAFRRVIVLTSIDAGALRGDLGERLLMVDLEPIAPHARRTEADLEAAYRALRPRVFGALLDLVCQTLAALPKVRATDLPRMADFAKVLAALDVVRGTDSLARFAAQSRRVASDVVEADPVASAAVALVAQCQEWRGTAGDFLVQCRPDDQSARDWPRNAKAMGARLKRLAPALLAVGVEVTPPSPTDKSRLYVVRAIARTAQSPEPRASTPDAPHEWEEI